ncbi:hypothetical protein C5167_031825 [Papaver somniferum]|uniref:Uncharacterized protein n=1 Tax=Papaver somniferum TaxID=3469 RepID=A0A4Y7K9K0_PAPSO|nr:hypothetical protein C5167_031825 [Papaver somniferum]
MFFKGVFVPEAGIGTARFVMLLLLQILRLFMIKLFDGRGLMLEKILFFLQMLL